MTIFRIIKNFVLILLIILIIFIPVYIYLVKFKNNSFIGEYLKRITLKNPKIVELLNLNVPGDARYLYLDPGNQSVSVKVVSVNSKKPNEEIDRWLREIIFETVNKNAVVNIIQNVGYPKTRLLTNEDLNEIRKNAISQDDGDLYLIYVCSYADKESSVGLVIHRDTIFIFRDAIEALSERGYVKEVLEKTTIMHEWGHLLGMDHIEDENCIMDESVEVYDSSPMGKDLPTKYCWEELQRLKKLY